LKLVLYSGGNIKHVYNKFMQQKQKSKLLLIKQKLQQKHVSWILYSLTTASMQKPNTSDINTC